jgi:hypothetical protein
MKLFKYYSLYEAYGNMDSILERLEQLQENNKIEFELENSDILMIKDIDLDDDEIEELVEFFDDNDVVPYLEREEDDEDDGGYIDDEFLDYDDY